jgi:hypothetical protein
MSDQTTADLARVAEIDAAFESATGWGSWMIVYANEREEIVNRLRANGHDIAHKYLARNDDGSRTD